MPLPTVSQVHISQALTNISVGYRQNMPPIADLIFPKVVVGKQSDKYYVWNKADQWRRQATKRAPGTKFTRGVIRLSNDSYQSEQYAWEYPLADEIRDNADDALALDMTISTTVSDTLALEKDLTFAADFFTSGSGWTPGSQGAGKWSAASSTPLKDTQGACRSIRRGLSGSRNHRLVALAGSLVEVALMTNSDIQDKLRFVQVGTIAAVRAALAGILGLDELIIADREYTTSAEGNATATFSPVFDDGLLLVAVPNSPGLMTPAAGYTFAWDEGGKGDFYVESYRDETIKSDIYRGVTHYDQKQVDAEVRR